MNTNSEQSPKISTEPRFPQTSVYIFVNPKSGGNAAAAIINIPTTHLTISDEGINATVAIFDIRDGNHGEKPGFQELKQKLDSESSLSEVNPLRVIVAGGDGTVMWAISEAEAHGTDMKRVCFGVIPYGTGNDFARFSGWGGSNPSKAIMKKEMKRFKVMLKRYIEAEVIDFDIWRVEMKVKEDGGAIKKIQNGGKENITNGDQENTLKKSMTKLMCNYFSVGIESRIGLGFDKKRTTSTIGNKIRYGIEGIKKLFTKTPRIGDVMDSCTGGDKSVIFSTDPSSPELLRGNPISLIFLNINSFAGGCDLWKVSSRRGLVNGDKKASFDPQSAGDQKLEVLTYKRLMGLSLEQSKNRILGGNGLRVGQFGGPMTLNFKKDLDGKRTYLQVDGEFFCLEHTESVTISHNETVKVLKRRL